MHIKNLPSIRYLILFVLGASCVLVSCTGQVSAVKDQVAVPVTPVQVISIQRSPLNEYTELTAVSAYQQKSYVKANMNGYVQTVNSVIGMQVQKGAALFSLITKEAKAIGNAVNELEPGLRFSGVSVIRADQTGFVSTVSHQKGDYVQDGEALAVINNKNSFVFLLDLPYELRRLVTDQQKVTLVLPDGEQLSGTFVGTLPTVDAAAQSLSMIIQAKPNHVIPEGLIAKVKLTKSSSPNAQVLPRSAILTNETEDQFWVMKLINDSTAVKVSVKKGMENDRFIEVLNPVFKASDRMISVGNYGMADTAKIKIVKQL